MAVGGGATADDIIQISFGYGLFTGALGLHYGLEKIGATVIPASSGNTVKQLMMFRDFGVTGLVATPSYALYLGESMKEAGYPRDAYKLRIGLLGSESCTPEMRAQIEESMGIFVSDNYGMTELGGPGVSGECELRCGLHFAEDHFLPEIVDPDTLLQKPEGEAGELVVTTLTREGMPGAALPHQGHYQAHLRALRLRAHPLPHGEGHGPHRRYAHHQGGQRLPHPD